MKSPINDIVYVCVWVFICIMKCFVSHCEKLGRLFFDCECEKRKASCDDHECFIKHVKYSCLLSWKCCRCFTRRGIGKCKLLPVKCFGIEYHICGACAITMMNELLFEDKKPERAKPYVDCDNCNMEIEPINRPYSISITVGNGWTWQVLNARYSYCTNCLNYNCEKFLK